MRFGHEIVDSGGTALVRGHHRSHSSSPGRGFARHRPSVIAAKEQSMLAAVPGAVPCGLVATRNGAVGGRRMRTGAELKNLSTSRYAQ